MRRAFVRDLKLGDVVRMAHSEDMQYDTMTVVSVSPTEVVCHRPYLIACCNTPVIPHDGKAEFRPHIGVEPVVFLVAHSSMQFVLLSKGNVEIWDGK